MSVINLAHPQAKGLVLLHGYAVDPRASDLSGNRNNGSLLNSPAIVGGKFGKALSLNGSSQGISVSESPSLDITGNEISFGCWVYPKSNAIYHLLGKDATNSVRQYALFLLSSTSSVHVALSGVSPGEVGTSYTLSIPWEINNWNHIFVTYKSGVGGAIYVNGKSAYSASWTGTVSHVAANVHIGYENENRFYFNGNIAEARIYNRALSAAEVLDLYVNPSALFNNKKKPIYLFLAASVVAQADLTGSSVSSATATGSISSDIAIIGAAISASSATGQLSSALPLSGASASATIAGGDLNLVISLDGGALASAIATGQINQTTLLEGDAQSTATGTGSLDGNAGFTGTAIASSNAIADLNIAITLSGNSISTSLSDAGLVIAVPLSGESQSITTALADLTSIAGGELSGNAQGLSNAAGQLNIDIPIAGTASAYASGTGNITSIIPLTGASSNISVISGDLQVVFTLSGNAITQVLSSGNLHLAVPLSGDVVAHSIATANLYVDTLFNYALSKRLYSLTPSNRSYTIPKQDRQFILMEL